MIRKKILHIVTVGLVASLLSGCVNGKGPKGIPVDTDSLPARDTVATLSPDGNDFMLLEGMGTCDFEPFFSARVDEKGIVTGQFRGFEDELFVTCLSADCPRDEITVETLDGRCVGIKCMVEGGGVDPVLLMLMDDGHVERISLYDLSEGQTRATQRSEQKGIVNLMLAPSSEGQGETIVGLLADSSRVDIDWGQNL